jgi:hypothetical protein
VSLEVRTAVCRNSWHYRRTQAVVNNIPPGRKESRPGVELQGRRLSRALDLGLPSNVVSVAYLVDPVPGHYNYMLGLPL